MYYRPDSEGSRQPGVWTAFLLAVALPLGAHGLKPLSENEMAGVAGRDGITVSIESDTGITADQVRWQVDSDTTAPARDPRSAIAEDVSVQGTNGPLSSDWSLDAGSDGAGNPGVQLQGSWDETLIEIGDWRHSGLPNKSLGTLGFVSEGSTQLVNTGGLFDSGSSNAYVKLESLGDVFYRQGPVGSPEMSFANFRLGLEYTDGLGNPGTGTFGVDNQGLVLASDFMDLDLNFDVYFAENPATSFDRVNRLPMTLFGWEGGIANAEIRARPGGLGPGEPHGSYVDSWEVIDHDGSLGGDRSEGLELFVQWDYGENFEWVLGQAQGAGNGVEVRFSDWQRFDDPDNDPGFDFRLPIILDAVDAGSGPGGISFGGGTDLGFHPSGYSLSQDDCENWATGCQFLEDQSQEGDFAVVIRDGRLHAFNRLVEVVDPQADAPFDSQTFGWGLIYTFGQLDTNIFLRPGHPDGSDVGLTANVALAIQSPSYWDDAHDNGGDPGDAGDNWATNTHFAIADTDAMFGIGLFNADLLWEARDMFVGPANEETGENLASGFRLETDQKAQYRFRGMLGGGDLNDLSDPVRIAWTDVNLETDRFAFVLTPGEVLDSTATEPFIGFEGLLDFNGNAYLSLAEPSNPQSNFQFGDVEGRVMWEDGRIQLSSGDGQSDGKPRFSIANDITFGETAVSNGAGEPFQGTVSFGGGDFGRVAIPGGRWYSDITLKRQ